MNNYRSEHLSGAHKLDSFSSGNDVVDTWLKNSARHAEAANTGRTFVWVDPSPSPPSPPSSSVLGYFTLAAHLIRRTEVPKAIGHRSPDAIPTSRSPTRR